MSFVPWFAEKRITTIKTYERCSKCNTLYETGPFRNMNANGENAYSSIVIDGIEYHLCPKCTNEVYKFINQNK